MESKASKKMMIQLLLIGMAGCVLLCLTDWLMIFGDPSYEGTVSWLTKGAAEISPERNAFSMMIAFPAIIAYCFGLFAVRYFLSGKHRKNYSALTIASLTPWLCLHLLYVMILFLFGWLNREGEQELALRACEAMFGHFQWMVPMAEVIMILPYLYLLVQVLRRKTDLPRIAALNNPLLIFVLLSVIKYLLPASAWKIGYTNGMMSEAMFIWFLVYVLILAKSGKAKKQAQ